ncbi:DUF1109 domain-containing protein [Haloarcula litorea]|uniref:DUF1109 domain-containing protein n=1 Tax=Haloarcula litorea TaxID=3032579 RepID=UPI0023E8C44D|nr:DUF1109 domain-containing protein [Halomicroarcula sp. GDY20]
MKFDIDSGKLLYALGIAFAAAALLYFVRDVVFGLSITVKAVLLLLAAVGFFLGGLAAERDVLDAVGFVLAAVTYVVFVGYVVVRYQPGGTATFLVLAISAALTLALGYLLRERDLSLPRRTVAASVGVVLVLGIALVGADVAVGGVTYASDFESSVTVTAPDSVPDDQQYFERDVRVGRLTATNGPVFTRALSLPELSGCLVGTDAGFREDVWLSYENRYDQADTIAGGATRQLTIRASLPVDLNETRSMTYAVERGSDCDADRASPTLLVQLGEE